MDQSVIRVLRVTHRGSRWAEAGSVKCVMLPPGRAGAGWSRLEQAGVVVMSIAVISVDMCNLD